MKRMSAEEFEAIADAVRTWAETGAGPHPLDGHPRRTEYRQELHRREKAKAIAAAEAEVLDFIVGAYANYRTNRAISPSITREPSLSLGLLAGYVAQTYISGMCPYSKGVHATRWFYSVTSAAIGRLLRAKKVVSSTGVGDGGREVRMYEPLY